MVDKEKNHQEETLEVTTKAEDQTEEPEVSVAEEVREQEEVAEESSEVTAEAED